MALTHARRLRPGRPVGGNVYRVLDATTRITYHDFDTTHPVREPGRR